MFCPPVATFLDPRTQKPATSAKASVFPSSVTRTPDAARSTLEALLGPATAVVESGGEWTNPATGEIQPKVHLHWRLKKPTATKAEHDLLREARELATELVGGDATNISIVHPIRWPGSWHRKGTPRLATIVASSDDNEIDLAEAVELLRDASGAAPSPDLVSRRDSKFEACSCRGSLRSAAIPNDDLDWHDWNRIGMATWAATGGSEEGREAFSEWSAKSPKNDPAATPARWQHYRTSPPRGSDLERWSISARKHSPGWTYESARDYSAEFAAEPVDPVDLWGRVRSAEIAEGVIAERDRGIRLRAGQGRWEPIPAASRWRHWQCARLRLPTASSC